MTKTTRERSTRHEDEAGRKYRLDNLTAAGTRKGKSGLPWRGIDPTARGYHWKFGIDRPDELEVEGRIYWPKKEGGVPQYKRYFDEVRGVVLQDIWDDISPLNSQAKERLGYPTQKPQSLLDRIIVASTNEGDVVLDPFCGCGTTISSAENLGRSWIGIDISFLAVALIEQRLTDTHAGINYEVHGVPKDIGGAQALFAKSHKNFEMWAVRQIGGRPQPKMGGDEGIDGIIRFYIDGKTWGDSPCLGERWRNAQPWNGPRPCGHSQEGSSRPGHSHHPHQADQRHVRDSHARGFRSELHGRTRSSVLMRS